MSVCVGGWGLGKTHIVVRITGFQISLSVAQVVMDAVTPLVHWAEVNSILGFLSSLSLVWFCGHSKLVSFQGMKGNLFSTHSKSTQSNA